MILEVRLDIIFLGLLCLLFLGIHRAAVSVTGSSVVDWFLKFEIPEMNFTVIDTSG